MPSSDHPFRITRSAWLCVGYVFLHTLSHLSASWFEVKPGITVSIWYPPVGLALALMVLLGPRMAPLVFLTNVATAWWAPEPRLLWPMLFFPALITACYATTAWAVRRVLGPGARLLPGAGWATPVFCLAVGAAPLVPALVSTTVINLTGLAGHSLTVREFVRSVFDWWLGDASGLLVVVPVAMVFAAPWLAGEPGPIRWRRLSAGAAARAVIRAGVLFGTLMLVVVVPVLRDHSAFYLCFLPLIWICMRHGLPGATLATMATMVVGLVGMRLAGTTGDFSYIFLLFEVAVAVVGLGLGTLVSHRDETQRALATSQARLDRVIDGARLGLWEHELASRRMIGNARLTEMVGYRLEELSPLVDGLPALIHAEDRKMAGVVWMDHVEGRRELFEVEVRLKAKDGSWRWVQSRGSIMVRDEQGRPLTMSGTQVDITDRKRAEVAVARLSGVVEASPDFVLLIDEEGRVLYANTATLARCGCPGAQAREAVAAGRLRVEDLMSSEILAQWRETAMPTARAEGAWLGEGELEDRAGRRIPVSQVVLARHDAEVDGLVFSFILRDITDQKRAEEERRERERELLQVQKSESLSVLAGGIAHDFNNLLTAIVGNANLARHGLEPGARALANLDNIEQASARAARLCQQMLAYAGRNPVAFAEIDLGALVRDVWRLLESSIPAKVRVRIEVADPLSPVLAADTQMQQVVMNLILNAAEAIGDRDGEVIARVRGATADADALAELFPGQRVPGGAWVLFEVEDTGAGMTPEVRARIFEPFFTTKFTGKGLGLAAVAGVVKSHRGHIAVRSEPGAGTCFRVAFPASEKAAAAPVAPADPAARRCSGLVLLVDDDELICEVGASILQALGFTTMTARDGAEGVERFREHADAVKAVLLDLTMPRMDGFVAHAEMHRINPRVPVILMSGFSSKLEKLPPEAIHPAGVLAKPFGVAQLRERLAAVLET